ncbi:hypothetical protein Scep_005394 [Stephania cephalantha]|uniref:Uncharacterized protein n=1 Tax=Stephania cephalantha TaxID=152367 RepID=A0AAP0KWT7_9MAGN
MASTHHQFYLSPKWSAKLSRRYNVSSTSSTTTTAAAATTTTVKNSSSTPPQRRNSFSRKCMSLVKEQRARFYIMRRCVTMLVCWREYADS